ncbi:hypothetical protein MY8738_009805 [Beauveria namnaoensis]
MSPPEITAKEFEEWFDGTIRGDPATSREYCQRNLSPDYVRLHAGGGRTDFEQAVEKVAHFRTICRKWEGKVNFLVQQGNKIAVRYTVNVIFGDNPEQHMELMFMAERDTQGRFQKVWELTEPIDESAKN